MTRALAHWTQHQAERWLIEYSRASPFAYSERVHEMLREQGDGSLPPWPEFLAALGDSDLRRYLSE